jgi:hypothetical protein
MDKIKEKLERFAKKDLAIREALAKRQDRLEARHRTLRVIGQAIGLEPNPEWRGQEYQNSGHQNGHQTG